MHSVALVGLAVTLAAAQVDEAPTSTVRSEVRRVEVQVVVRDKASAAAVRDLAKEDFVLLEDGRPRPILSFNVVDRNANDSELRDGRSKAEEALFSNRRLHAAGRGRTVAFLVDAINARAEDTAYALRAASAVLRQSGPADRVAVYVLEARGLAVVHDYHESVAALLDRIALPGPMGEDLIGGGSDAPFGGSKPEMERGSGEAARQAEILRFLDTMTALRTIASHLHYLPGRKSLVWLSAGFRSGVVLENSRAWQRTVSELNDASVAVYGIDSSGLRMLSGFSAAVPSGRSLPSGRLSVIRATRDNDVLLAMARATGGLLYENRNDLAKAAQAALADSDVVYTLTYSPGPKRWDNRFVPVEVKVKRRGVHVRHRAGYYAAAEALPDENARDRKCRDLLLSPVDATGLGLSAPPVRMTANDTGVALIVSDPNSLKLRLDNGHRAGRIDVCFGQVLADGSLAAVFTDEVPIRLTEDQFRTIEREGFAYPREIHFLAGAATLRVAVIDHNSGGFGSLSIQLSTK